MCKRLDSRLAFLGATARTSVYGRRNQFRRNPPLRRGDGGEVPFAGHALELVSAALVKLKPRPDHEVAQRAGHQHVVRTGQGAHARTDVHSETADVVGADLASVFNSPLGRVIRDYWVALGQRVRKSTAGCLTR